MDHVKFWSRVGHWFRHAGRGDGHPAGLGPLGDDALMGDADGSQTAAGQATRSGLVFSSKKRQREEAIEKLQDGFLQVTLTAAKDLEEHNIGMDYVFVSDVSGSMANDRKLVVSQDSVRAFIQALGGNDRFELMSFNVTAETLFGKHRSL